MIKAHFKEISGRKPTSFADNILRFPIADVFLIKPWYNLKNRLQRGNYAATKKPKNYLKNRIHFQ